MSFLLIAPLLALVAQAQEPAPRPEMGVNLRVRALAVPGGIIDTWTERGSGDLSRPKVRGTAVGLEYAIKPGATNFLFYGEYLNFRVDAGYWNDIDEYDDDGHWVDPTGAGAAIFGFDTAYEPALTDPNQTVWLSMLVGGGVGVLVQTGELEVWFPGDNLTDDDVVDETCLPDAPSYERKEACDADTENAGIPGVLPVIDFMLAFKLNIGPHFSVRMEGGLHDAPYWGGAVGARF